MPDEFGNPLPGEEETFVVEEEETTAPDPTALDTGDGTTTPPVDDGTALAPPVEEGDGSSGPGDSYRDAATDITTRDTGSYSGYNNPSENVDTLRGEVGGVEEYMTPETTVAGQLERLLGRESGLEQQARVSAREKASALGMMSSSAAIGATRRASVEALSPIAAKDAETAKQFQQQKQQAQNEITKIQVEAEVSGSLTQQKAQITEESKRIDQEWQAIMTGLDAESKEYFQNMQQDFQEKMTNLEADVKRELTQMGIDAEVEQMILNQGHESLNNYQITVQQLLANDAFLDNFAGDKTAMHGLFNDLFQTVESDMILAAKSTGVYDELEPYITEMAADNTW